MNRWVPSEVFLLSLLVWSCSSEHGGLTEPALWPLTSCDVILSPHVFNLLRKMFKTNKLLVHSRRSSEIITEFHSVGENVLFCLNTLLTVRGQRSACFWEWSLNLCLSFSSWMNEGEVEGPERFSSSCQMWVQQLDADWLSALSCN